MVEIKQQNVSASVINARTYGHDNPVDFILVHQTGSMNNGANAAMHAKLQTNLNPRQASWHISIDDKEAIQSFSATARCWATGDGKTAKGGNMTGLHIELAINSDGNYKKTIENGADVVAQLLKKHKLTIDKVKRILTSLQRIVQPD